MGWNMRALIIVIELFLFSGFIWALVCWFKNSKTVKRWELVYIKTGGIMFLIAQLSCACLSPLPSYSVSMTGILLLLSSGVLFALSLLSFRQPPGIAFADQISVELNTLGPYRFIRHPFYTSYSLSWIGGTMATGCWLLSISFIMMGIIYYTAAKEEENLWLNSKNSKKYKEYMDSTGMFIIRVAEVF